MTDKETGSLFNPSGVRHSNIVLVMVDAASDTQAAMDFKKTTGKENNKKNYDDEIAIRTVLPCLPHA